LLKHPTLDQLYALGLHGMAKAFADLADADEPRDLVHADWLALLLDRETSWRKDKVGLLFLSLRLPALCFALRLSGCHSFVGSIRFCAHLPALPLRFFAHLALGLSSRAFLSCCSGRPLASLAPFHLARRGLLLFLPGLLVLGKGQAGQVYGCSRSRTDHRFAFQFPVQHTGLGAKIIASGEGGN
jgi:hypothetical protein